MSCHKCSSNRVLSLYGKCSDLAGASMEGFDYEHDGYAPEIPNVCSGDDIQFDVCLDCGQVQGEWPLAPTKFEEKCVKEQKKLEERKADHEAMTTNFNEDDFFNS